MRLILSVSLRLQLHFFLRALKSANDSPPWRVFDTTIGNADMLLRNRSMRLVFLNSLIASIEYDTDLLKRLICFPLILHLA